MFPDWIKSMGNKQSKIKKESEFYITKINTFTEVEVTNVTNRFGMICFQLLKIIQL